MGTILLCRHGETTWNREGRVQGWAPAPLTDEGRAEAAALANGLAAEYDIDRLVTSDLQRAVETARPVGRKLEITPEQDPAWRERDFGCLQGLTRDELFGGHPEFALSESGYAAAQATPESGESILDQWDRVLDAWEALCRDIEFGETVAVITHGGVLYAITGTVKRLDVVAAVLEQEQDNAAVTEFRITDDVPELVRENVTLDGDS